MRAQVSVGHEHDDLICLPSQPARAHDRRHVLRLLDLCRLLDLRPSVQQPVQDGQRVSQRLTATGLAEQHCITAT